MHGSFEWMELQVRKMGREDFETRETCGGDTAHVVTVCLFHGQHRARVVWHPLMATRVRPVPEGFAVDKYQVGETPQIMTACGPACGPRFTWGDGCRHVD